MVVHKGVAPPGWSGRPGGERGAAQEGAACCGRLPACRAVPGHWADGCTVWGCAELLPSSALACWPPPPAAARRRRQPGRRARHERPAERPERAPRGVSLLFCVLLGPFACTYLLVCTPSPYQQSSHKPRRPPLQPCGRSRAGQARPPSKAAGAKHDLLKQATSNVKKLKVKVNLPAFLRLHACTRRGMPSQCFGWFSTHVWCPRPPLTCTDPGQPASRPGPGGARHGGRRADTVGGGGGAAARGGQEAGPGLRHGCAFVSFRFGLFGGALCARQQQLLGEGESTGAYES